MDGSINPIEQLVLDELNKSPRSRWLESDEARKESDILTIAATIGVRRLPDGQYAGDVYSVEQRRMIVRQLYPTG